MSRQQFDKDNLKALREVMQVALDQVSALCEVSFDVGSCTYSPQNGSFKVEIANVVDGEVKKQEVEDWKRYAEQYGFKLEDLGREFAGQNGHKCKITGLLPSRHKYPIQYLDLVTGKTFVSTSTSIKRRFGEFKESSPKLTPEWSEF